MERNLKGSIKTLKPKKLSGNFAPVLSPHTRDLPRTDPYSSLSLGLLPSVPCYTPGYRVQTGLFLLSFDAWLWMQMPFM